MLYLIVIVIGTLVGLEIPLLMRILKERFQFHDLVAHVLTFDYLGALGASLLFPLLAGAASWTGAIGDAVRHHQCGGGAVVDVSVSRIAGRPAGLRVLSAVVLVAARRGNVRADAIAASADDNLYADEVIFARNTRYQRIVLTKWKNDLRLFLSSHLQFSSRDEYRYHEALVHPGLACAAGRAARAGAGRRRRTGGSRNFEVPVGGADHAGGSRSGDDGLFTTQSGAGRA